MTDDDHLNLLSEIFGELDELQEDVTMQEEQKADDRKGELHDIPKNVLEDIFKLNGQELLKAINDHEKKAEILENLKAGDSAFFESYFVDGSQCKWEESEGLWGQLGDESIKNIGQVFEDYF